MAKKKATRRPSATRAMLPRLQHSWKAVQRDAEALLRRTRTEATKLLSCDQKHVLDRLVTQAQQVRRDVEKQLLRASKDVEPRLKHLFSTLEKEAEKRLERGAERLVHQLGLTWRREVRDLSQRIAHLEQRLQPTRAPHRPKKVAPASMVAPPTLSSSPDLPLEVLHLP